MAITKAQQAKQLLQSKAPKGEFLAYINKKEAKMLKDAGGSGIMTNAGIPSFVEYGGRSGFEGAKAGREFSGGNRDNERDNLREQASVASTLGKRTPTLKEVREIVQKGPDRTRTTAAQDLNQQKIKEEAERRIAEEKRRREEIEKRRQEKIDKQIEDYNTAQLEKLKKGRKFKTFEQKTLEDLLRDEEEENKPDVKPGFFDKLKGSIRNFTPPSVSLLEGITDLIPGRKLSDMYIEYGDDYKNFEDYQRDVLAGKISTKGGPMGGFFRDGQGNLIGGREGSDNQIIPQVVPTTTGSVLGSTNLKKAEVDNRTEFEKLLASRPGAFRFFADGGMADDDPVGGIMDLESGRQMYKLGKLVKSVTKSIKKIAKSPIGKAALIGGLAYFGGGGGLPKLLGGKGLGGFSAKTFFSKANPLLFTKDKLSLGKLAAFSAASPFLFPAKQEEEEQEPYLGPSIDIPAIRRDPYGAMGGAYSFYAEGGKAEPVAKKTMPLLDMDGMEKDYRETGGFVEMGRMERADDVPARLSKNEFVFTADAVRNAGDGSVDKGAEVMYNMMKNLEAGGEVSEESQGLEGARKMFQTSQRLGEVI